MPIALLWPNSSDTPIINHLYIVYQTKEVALVIRKAARRRRALLIITPVIFVGLSIAALFLIEPRYTSSTSILVQEQESLDPMALFNMQRRDEGQQTRMESLNEIIFSRSAMEMLIDSLNFENPQEEGKQRKQLLVERLSKSIEIKSESSDSFEINFTDTDPERARDAVELLASYYMDTRVRLNRRKHEEVVEFFTDKLNDLEQMVAEQRTQSADVTTERMRESPLDVTALQSRLDRLDSRYEELDLQIYRIERQQSRLNQFNDMEDDGEDIQILYSLSFGDLPFGEELDALLSEHDELSDRYTPNYPRLRTLSNQIRRVAERIPAALESELDRLNDQMADLSAQRSQLISDMEQSFVASQRESSQESDYVIYEGLYNDMKVRLQEARMAQEAGSRVEDQFMILDAPYVPEEQSSPSMTLLLALGMTLGLVFGVIISAIAEALDTTIRDEIDLKYQKPVIAYLTNG